MYSIKKVHETLACITACLEKRTDWILRIFTFNDKNSLYFPIISTLQFFRGSKWSRSSPISHKTIWHMLNIKNSEFKLKKMLGFSKPLFFFHSFFWTIPHINSETNPPTPISMLFASIWDSFFAQASVLLLFQYCATLSRGEGPNLFLQKCTIPEFQEIFTGIDLISIIYVRYCCYNYSITNHVKITVFHLFEKVYKWHLKMVNVICCRKKDHRILCFQPRFDVSN